jgi:hypothetical protein
VHTAKIHNGPLAPLLQRLKMAGYSISIEQMLDIHAFFLSTSLAEINVDELKYLIAPLIAKSPEDQENIYGIIDEYIAEAVGKKNTPKKHPLLQERKPQTFRGKRTSILIALFATLSGFFFAFAMSLIFIPSRPALTLEPGPPPDSVTIQRTDTINPSPSLTSSKLLPAYEITATQKIMPVSIERPTVAFRLAIILGILIGVLLSFFLFSVKTKEYTTGETGENAYMKSEDITFPLAVDFTADEHKLLSENKAMLQARKNFEKHMPGTSRVLNIERSIGETIANGGAYTLWFENTHEKRKLLFLVDARFPGGHIEKLFDHLLKKLDSEKLSIERYSYQQSLLELRDATGRMVSLKEISNRDIDRQLIIIGECENIFNGNDHAEETLRLLLRWPSRSMITPVPLADWGHYEGLLLQKKFKVAPADIKAVELLSYAILLNNVTGAKELSAKMKDAYSVSGFDFKNINDLRDYLVDENIFQFVCSLAVYPKISWPLTISLYDALLRNKIPAQEQYDLLLKISRIYWLNFDKLDDELRLSLLNELRPATERAARKKILELLKEMEKSVPSLSPAGKELEIQKTLNQFILFAHNKKAFKEYSDSTKYITRIWDELQEQPLKKHIDSGKGKLFQEHAGRHMNMQEFFAREKEVRKRRITLGRISVTLIPPLIIYLLMTWFQPGFAYLHGSEQLKYQPADVTLVFTKDACSKADRVEIDVAGKQYYVSMANETETLRLIQVEYDTPVKIIHYSGGLPRVAELNASHLSFSIKLKACEKE